MTFRNIHLLDTAVATDNIGDEIIVRACHEALSDVLRDSYVTNSSSHDGLGPRSRNHVAAADLVFLLGTNALSAASQKAGTLANWHFTNEDLPALEGKVILLGVGAKSSFSGLDTKQAQLLRHVLSADYLHAVRDASALSTVEAVGLRALNTTCPTLWGWKELKSGPPSEKSPEVCFSLTNHKSDPHLDRMMIDILRKSYDRLWFWPQHWGDIPYLKSLDRIDGVSIVPPNLFSYEAFLKDHNVDVIGTRLHGTILGLMRGRRSIVIAIDNRAEEISVDTSLPTVKRNEIASRLSGLIDAVWETELFIDLSTRDRFLGQFLPRTAANQATAKTASRGEALAYGASFYIPVLRTRRG